MKAFQFSRSSFHYKIAKKFGGLDDTDWYGDPKPLDLCHYIRCLLWAFTKGLVVLAVSSLVIWSATDAAFWVKECIDAGEFLTLKERVGVLFIGAAGFVSAAAVLLGAIMCIVKLWDRYSDDYEEREPGFLKLAYQSIKNKTCFRIEMKD